MAYKVGDTYSIIRNGKIEVYAKILELYKSGRNNRVRFDTLNLDRNKPNRSWTSGWLNQSDFKVYTHKKIDLKDFGAIPTPVKNQTCIHNFNLGGI